MKLSFPRSFVHWLKNNPERPLIPWTLSILWLMLIGWLVCFWNLGATGLVDETEPLFAEAARQMLVTGDWITPFFDGETRFDKPILIYWLMAIAYKIVGVNSWAVRLPSALSAMGLVGLGFYTLWFCQVRSGTQLLWPDDGRIPKLRYWVWAGFGAALIVLNPETMVWARIGTSDMLLTSCMGGALLCFFLGYAQPLKPVAQGCWYLAFYVLVALAVLTKGPVGLVVPVLIVGAFVLYLGKGREVWREMHPLWGSLLMLALALPWYVLVTQANGWAFIDTFLGRHNFDRFTKVFDRTSEPWYSYFFVILLGFAPWSVYLPAAIGRLKFWRRDVWRSTPRLNHLGLFALFWFLGVWGFFSIAVTKRPSYMLPLMPAAAILVALLWSHQLLETKNFRGNKGSQQPLLVWGGWLNVGLVLVVACVCFFGPNFIGYDPAMLNPRQLLQQAGLPVVGAVIATITAFVITVLLWRRQWQALLIANFLGFAALLIFVCLPLNSLIDEGRQLPLRQLSAIAVQVQQPGEPLIMVGYKKPSVVFYTQQRVNYIPSPTGAVEEIKKIVATQPQSSLLILSQPEKLQKMGLQPSQYQNLGQAGPYQLIRIFVPKVF